MWFGTVARFLREGIIDPIFEGMVSKEEINFIKDYLQNNTNPLEDCWANLAAFVQNGIINPLNEYFPNTTEIMEALTRINLITDIMNSVKNAMLKAARRKVVLVDHTKFGQDHFASLGNTLKLKIQFN